MDALEQHPWENDGCPGHLLLPSAGMLHGEWTWTSPEQVHLREKPPILASTHPSPKISHSTRCENKVPSLPGIWGPQAQRWLDQGCVSAAKFPLAQTCGLRFPGYSLLLPVCS